MSWDVAGCVNVVNLLSKNNYNALKFANALKLVTEVIPNNGGRLLRVRSVFTVVNNTNHDMDFLTKLAVPVSQSEKTLSR
jgi:hypothetical protein